MEYQDLLTLANDYKVVLTTELDAKIATEVAKTEVAHAETVLLAQATADGKIDGKNEDTRRSQRENILTQDQIVQEGRTRIATLELVAQQAEIEVKHIASIIRLTEAWLHSQAK